METTGELAMWDKWQKSNLLLKSKIKTRAKHNLPAGQVVFYTAVFSVVGESPTTLTRPGQACPADCIAYSLVPEQIISYSNSWKTTKILKETGLSN